MIVSDDAGQASPISNVARLDPVFFAAAIPLTYYAASGLEKFQRVSGLNDYDAETFVQGNATDSSWTVMVESASTMSVQDVVVVFDAENELDVAYLSSLDGEEWLEFNPEDESRELRFLMVVMNGIDEEESLPSILELVVVPE